MEKERKGKKWGSGPVTLKGRITCEFIELLVHFEKSIWKVNMKSQTMSL